MPMIGNYIQCEIVKELHDNRHKSIFLPKSKQFSHVARVVAIGHMVSQVKENDLVIVPKYGRIKKDLAHFFVPDGLVLAKFPDPDA